MRTMLVLTAAAAALTLAGCGSKPGAGTSETTTAGTATPGAPMKVPDPAAGPAVKGNPAGGKKIYVQNCQGCHAPNGVGALEGTPNLTNAAWWKQETDADLLEVIRNGKDKMPAFQGRLSEQQMADVLAYLHTLEKK